MERYPVDWKAEERGLDRGYFLNISGWIRVLFNQFFEQALSGGAIGSILFRSKQCQCFFNMNQRQVTLVQVIINQAQIKVRGTFIWIMFQGF